MLSKGDCIISFCYVINYLKIQGLRQHHLLSHSCFGSEIQVILYWAFSLWILPTMLSSPQGSPGKDLLPGSYSACYYWCRVISKLLDWDPQVLMSCWLEASFGPLPYGPLHRTSQNMAVCFVGSNKWQDKRENKGNKPALGSELHTFAEFYLLEAVTRSTQRGRNYTKDATPGRLGSLGHFKRLCIGYITVYVCCNTL